jgi:TRAP-type C4-dicarboxylate transport system substrate-binding protein
MYRPSKYAVAIAALLTTSVVASTAAADELTIATLAPKKSAWGKVFNAWSKAVKSKTNGKLELHFYWNGTQGTGATVVNKLKSGQLDGCTLSANGLSEIYQPVLALQLPGVFTTWESIDRATTALYPEFQKAFEKQGFYLSSIGDVGRARTMSKGKAIRSPQDLKGMKPFSPRKGVVAPIVASVLGLTPVRVGFAEILPSLSAGRINVLTVPALAAEQLQWAPYLDHVGSDVAGIAIGAMVLSQARLSALPSDAVAIMTKTGKKAGKMLRRRVRKMDDQAFQRLSKRMTVVTLTAAERNAWQTKFAEVRRQLGQRVFTPQLVTRIEKLGGL